MVFQRKSKVPHVALGVWLSGRDAYNIYSFNVNKLGTRTLHGQVRHVHVTPYFFTAQLWGYCIECLYVK